MPDEELDLEAETSLRRKLLMADIRLKRKQAFWETPRNIVILLGVAVAIAGVVGFKFGSTPQTINVHLDGPLTIAPK